ncbi:MAG: hypothetical protein FWF41_00895 [Betaproteobacteria bacterium]|nr:hypothetical protein [Betaproteobacteria bacterium]
MFKFLRSKSQPQSEHPSPAVQVAPDEIAIEGMAPLAFTKLLEWDHGFPIPDWPAIYSWEDTAADEPMRNEACAACERAWLLHFGVALGADYRLSESERVLVLSSAEPKVAQATLAYMERVLERICGMLKGLAEVLAYGKEILILFDEQDDYYRYVFHYYPEEGEFAHSSGVFINKACGHFVTTKSDLSLIEPTIVHEMTHACLSYLPLPTWLNEGLAVNVEQALTKSRVTRRDLDDMQETRQKHLSFWGESEIQEFWSGASFYRAGDINSLSYDLARILVEYLARDWERFRQFALTAHWNDGGASAAREFLGVSLGALVASLLEKEDDAELFEPHVIGKTPEGSQPA